MRFLLLKWGPWCLSCMPGVLGHVKEAFAALDGTPASPSAVWPPAPLSDLHCCSLSGKPHMSYPLHVKPCSRPTTREGSPKRYLGTFLHTDSSPLVLFPIISGHFKCTNPWPLSLWFRGVLLTLCGFQLPEPQSITCPDEPVGVGFSYSGIAFLCWWMFTAWNGWLIYLSCIIFVFGRMSTPVPVILLLLEAGFFFFFFVSELFI